jgi:uncharacterized repeat protein (TIGR01451 family)
LIVGCALIAAIVAAPTATLATAPGTPGVPQAPAQVFFEDFEHNPTNAAVPLTSYTGSAQADNETYKAAPGWLTDCNGWIVMADSADPGIATTHCYSEPPQVGNAFPQVPPFAGALGQFEGASDAAANHALSAFTGPCSIPGAPQLGTEHVCGGKGQVEWATNGPIAVRPHRFYTFAVNIATAHCLPDIAPLYAFYLVIGGQKVPTFTTPIDACATYDQSIHYRDVTYLVGASASDSAVLVSADSVGLELDQGQESTRGNDSAFDNVRLLDATPQLDKSFSPPIVDVGESSTLTFTITNTTDLAAKKGWSFADRLPEGLKLADPPDGVTTCSGGSVSASPGAASVEAHGNLDTGQAACTVSVNVTSERASSYENGASNVESVGLNPPGSSTVQFAEADLAITKRAAPSPAVPGTNETYTLSVQNKGPDAAHDVVVSDPLPQGLSFVSASAECSFASGKVTCTLGSLPAGDSRQIVVAGRVGAPDGSTIVNSASVTADTHDPAPSNNAATASVPVRAPSEKPPVEKPPVEKPPAQKPPPSNGAPSEENADLAIAKTAKTSTVTAGGEVTYTLAVENRGPGDAGGVTVSDPLPAGLTLVSATATQGSCNGREDVSCSLGKLSDGGRAEVVVIARVAGSMESVIVNIGSVASSAPDPKPSNNASTVSLQIAQGADLALTKSASLTAAASGGQVTYTLTVTNDGPSDAEDVTVVDPLPGGLGPVSAMPSQGECSGRALVRCRLGTIAAGGSAQVVVTTAVARGFQSPIRNIAAVTSVVADPLPADNRAGFGVLRAQSRQPVSDLEITKTADRADARTGEALTYSMKVRNHGPAIANDVRVTDTASLGLAVLSARPSHGSCGAGRPTTCALGTLPVGASATITVRAEVRLAGNEHNTATVTSSSADPRPVNNISSTRTRILAATRTRLQLRKTAAPRTVQAGRRTSFQLTVTNPGSVALDGVEVCDSLPLGLAFVGAAPRSTLRSGRQCWTLESLDGRSSHAFRLVAVALRGAGGALVNVATASAKGAEGAAARTIVRVRAGQPAATPVTG